MSQDNIFEKVRLYTEVPKKLPPLRSNSTKPQQRGLVNSTTNSNHMNKYDIDQKRDSQANKDISQYFSNISQSNNNDSQPDLGVVLEQFKLQNKLNDQELQSVANRIQFIQNQQMNVWKKTNDLYEKAVYIYENKKRYQIESKMKEKLKQQKQKEVEMLAFKNDQFKEQTRQKLLSNNEQFLINKKKQAQEIKDKSRELNQLRDYFQSTFQQAKKTKHQEVKQNYQKAQVKIQNFYEEKHKQFKDQYSQKIIQEQIVKDQKQQQLRELEDVEKSLLDQFKRTKIQCDQLVNQLDEAQNLKPEEIESKYPIFVSLAYKNIIDANQYELQVAQQNNLVANNNIGVHNLGYQHSQNSLSPLKKNTQINRNRQHSQNKVMPLQILQQDQSPDQMNKTHFARNFQAQQQIYSNQYNSIQPKVTKSASKNQQNSSYQGTLHNSRYGYIYRSANAKAAKQNRSNLNYSAIYENESNSNKESSSIGHNKLSQEEKLNEFDNQEFNMHTFEVKDQLNNEHIENNSHIGILTKENTDINDEHNHSNDKMSSSPEKNNSTKVSLSNRGQQSKSPKREKQISGIKTSQTKIDLSMYQPRNQNNKKISLENNSSSFLIATEGDSNVIYNKRNKFNHFGDIMLNRDDITKQRKLIQSQQKQTRSKSFVTPSKLEVISPYQQSNNSNNNLKF